MKTTIDKKFFERWKDKKVAMHCRTKEEAKEFCEILSKNGYSWRTGDPYSSHRWNIYEKNTVYFFNSGTFGCLKEAKEGNYTILEFEDYIVPEKKRFNLTIYFSDGTYSVWKKDEFKSWEWDNGRRMLHIYNEEDVTIAIYNLDNINGFEER